MNTILCISIAMAVGLLFNRLMKLVNLPNVTGYLIAGLLIGPHVFGLIDTNNLEGLEVLTSVALGFIAFSIGVEFKFSKIKKLGGKIVTITLCQALFATLLVDVSLWAVGVPLPITLTLGAIATATAPAATLMVVRQYKAKGIVTDTLLPVVALDDAVGLMVFSVSIAIAEVLVLGTALTFTSTVLAPLLEIVASLFLGAVLGVVLTIACRLFKSRANRISCILVVVLAGTALAEIFNLSGLLVCMLIGGVFVNARKDGEEIINNTSERWTPPLFMMFFLLSGAEMDISILPTVSIIGIVYLIARSLGKYFGAFIGSSVTHADKNVRKYLGLTLLPQAGVAIGMAQLASQSLGDIGTQISTVVLCATLIYELVGPIITKIALSKAGEIPESHREKVFRHHVDNPDVFLKNPECVGVCENCENATADGSKETECGEAVTEKKTESESSTTNTADAAENANNGILIKAKHTSSKE